MTTGIDDMVINPSTASGEWAEVEAGAYDAIVYSIEDTGTSAQYPDSGPQLKIGFALEDVADEDGNMVVLNKWISQKWSDKSNLFLLARACGVADDPKQPFKVSALLDGKCQVVVVRKNQGQDNERPGIETFMPRRKAAARTAPKAAAPAKAAAPEPDGIGDCVVCDEPGTRFTGKGKPVCDAHGD